ncbi:MAG: PqqD family peptide modification chaperone [Pseudomonadota bacterium]
MTRPDDNTPDEQADANRLIVRGREHVETRVGDRVMAMSLDEGKYFAMQSTGGRIWDLLEAPKSEAELVEALCAEYDVAPAQCLRDLRAFLNDLRDHGLIEERER